MRKRGGRLGLSRPIYDLSLRLHVFIANTLIHTFTLIPLPAFLRYTFSFFCFSARYKKIGVSIRGFRPTTQKLFRKEGKERAKGVLVIPTVVPIIINPSQKVALRQSVGPDATHASSRPPNRDTHIHSTHSTRIYGCLQKRCLLAPRIRASRSGEPTGASVRTPRTCVFFHLTQSIPISLADSGGRI
jgi:hypothetical protein